MKRLILDIYDGDMIRQIHEHGYKEVMFDLPPNIACIRLTALIKHDFPKQKERLKEINEFLQKTKKFRIVLEEVE